MEEIQHKIQNLTATINNYDNLLIHHISPNIKVRQRLNDLLSKELLHLPKEAIKAPVSQTSEPLTIYDGAIDTTDIPSGKEFSSLERLKEERDKLKEKEQSLQKILTDSKALEKAEKAWGEKLKFLEKVKLKPALLNQQRETQAALKEEIEKSQEYAKELVRYKEEKKTINHNLGEERKEQQNRSLQRASYTSREQEIHKLDLPTIQQPLEEQDLEKLYTLVTETHITAERKSREAYNKLLTLLQKLDMQHINIDNRDAAIDKIQEEYNSMENLDKQMAKVSSAIYLNIISPTQAFLDGYETLKDKIEGFSQKLTHSHVSGIRYQKDRTPGKREPKATLRLTSHQQTFYRYAPLRSSRRPQRATQPPA